MTSHSEQARALHAAALRDYRTFLILLRDPSSPIETTLFHAQQAVEKGLKAVLVAEGILFPRTHDLLELFDLASNNGLSIPLLRDLLARLGPYAVEFRYLGVIVPEVSREQTLAAVETFMGWLKERLP